MLYFQNIYRYDLSDNQNHYNQSVKIRHACIVTVTVSDCFNFLIVHFIHSMRWNNYTYVEEKPDNVIRNRVPINNGCVELDDVPENDFNHRLLHIRSYQWRNFRAITKTLA